MTHSNVLKTHKGRIRTISEEQVELAEKKYVSSVYFHTLFLFTIARSRQYTSIKTTPKSILAAFGMIQSGEHDGRRECSAKRHRYRLEETGVMHAIAQELGHV